VNSRVTNLIERYGRAFGTVTADSGMEFHNYERIEARSKAVFYFAKPYPSWVWGSNENINGLTRQNLPKCTSMSGMSEHQGDAIAGKLTMRPRKQLGCQRLCIVSMNLTQCCGSNLLAGAAQMRAHHLVNYGPFSSPG
jgi:transposase, IS30 family